MDALIRALPRLLTAARDNEEVGGGARTACGPRAGEPLCQHAVPFRLYDRTLVVAVSDAIWQKQMSALSGQLLSVEFDAGKGQHSFHRFSHRSEDRCQGTRIALLLAAAETAESVIGSVPEDV